MLNHSNVKRNAHTADVTQQRCSHSHGIVFRFTKTNFYLLLFVRLYKSWQKLLTPDIVSLLTQIHEFKGEQTLFIETKADTLTQLMEIAKIQSTEASNKIEGIFTSLSLSKDIDMH